MITYVRVYFLKGDYICTYQTSFEILHPFSAQHVCDEPGKCGSVLPGVVKQEEGLLCDPHFFDTIGNSHQH